MSKKIIKLTESDLVRIVRRVIKEEYVYSIYELKRDLEKMGLEVNVKNEGGGQYVDDRFNDVIVQNNYRVTAITSNDEEKLKVWEFISKKNTNNVKLEDNSISFSFAEPYKAN